MAAQESSSFGLKLLGTVGASYFVASVISRQVPEYTTLYLFGILSLVEFGFFFSYHVFVYPLFLSPLNALPKPPGGLPFFGHTALLRKRPSGQGFLEMIKMTPNDGLIMFRGIFNIERVVVVDTKAIGEILVTKTYDFEKPTGARNFLRTVLGDGLIIIEGDEHRFMRKNTMPAFSFRHIKELYPIFWQKATQLTQGISQQVNDKMAATSADKESGTAVVEVNHWANRVTMDIIGIAAMGRDFHAMQNGEDPLIVNYEELLEPTREKQIFFGANAVLGMKFVGMLPWKLNERHRIITSNLTNICLQLVRDKKEMIKTEPETHKDILSLLLRTNNFSDKHLVDQLLTFLAAGHETTSSAFTWTTFLLAKHPEIQAALRKEIRENLPSPHEPIPADADIAAILESLPLLNGVCNETLRLYPTVPVTIRKAVKPTSLLGKVIPQGTLILLPPWAVNRSPKLWGETAEEFVPERWIDTDEKTGERRPNNSGGAASNYAILTFLHGPRSCIGQGFAKAELRCLVAAFVGSFEMEMADPNEQVIPSGVITTKPENGMNLRLKPVSGW